MLSSPLEAKLIYKERKEMTLFQGFYERDEFLFSDLLLFVS